jgi:Ran-binding protein 3
LGFGNTSSSSAFGGLGKSGLGGGFAGSSALGGFGGISSGAKPAFASASGPVIEGISSKPAKAFGASNDTDDEEGDDTDNEDGDESGAKSPQHESDNKKDRRFYEQHIETGEEGETTMFQQRAKLYQFDKEGKKWVERGSGVLKLNIKESEDATEDAEEGKAKLMDAPEEDDEEDAGGKKKVSGRLLLRADGSQRVVLNSPITKPLKFGGETEPTGQTILFLGRLAGSKDGDAGLETLQIKVCSLSTQTYV